MFITMEYGDTTVSLCTTYGSTNAQLQIFLCDCSSTVNKVVARLIILLVTVI